MVIVFFCCCLFNFFNLIIKLNKEKEAAEWCKKKKLREKFLKLKFSKKLNYFSRKK